jgi:hypothetical protein
MLRNYILIIGLSLWLSPLNAALITMLGFEGPAREPPGNLHERWVGLQYTSDHLSLNSFHPFLKLLGSTRFTHDYLLSAGLTTKLQPVTEWPDLHICLQTGPSLSDVGSSHTGSHLNWTTDLFLRYKILVVGYSHTSNGSFASPNSGLDLLILGVGLHL